MDAATRLAIYYEHPDWFRPLFRELERRGVPYVPLHAGSHAFDPAEAAAPTVRLNRMSPSAWLRGAAHAIHYTGELLQHFERCGVRVINGAAAWATEVSKARQIGILHELGLPCPRSRVLNDGALAAEAAAGLRFPVIVKPNIGGSGAGVVRFDSPPSLARAAEAGAVTTGIDGRCSGHGR